MGSHENKETIDFTIRNKSTDEQQNPIIVSFESTISLDEDQNQFNYKRIVGTILRGRDVIVVSKEDQLKDLISDEVDTPDVNYVKNNATGVVSFTPHPESNIKHHATLLKAMPIGVAGDLANSTEFLYGNLWFLIDTGRSKEDVIDDVRKLTPSAYREMPFLKHEAVASPAMYDGLEILWFNPNINILTEKFAYKI